MNNGKYYDVSFDLQKNPPSKIAQYFCSTQKELQITSQNQLSSCTEQVEGYIVRKLREINADIPESMSPSAESGSTIESPATDSADSVNETVESSQAASVPAGEAENLVDREFQHASE